MLRRGCGRFTTWRILYATRCSALQIHESCNSIAMAPSDKVLSNAIRTAVRRMFKGPDRDNLTVNNIREQVETELHLDAGFLKQGSWKQESKSIVKAESVITILSYCQAYSLKLLNPVCRTSFFSSKRLVKSFPPFNRHLPRRKPHRRRNLLQNQSRRVSSGHPTVKKRKNGSVRRRKLHQSQRTRTKTAL
jgi:hypothetical protein